MRVDSFKMMVLYFLPKKALTVFGGFMAELTIPAVKNYLIHWFIGKYQVDMQEALEKCPEQYPNFNAFFIRQLKPGLRPVAQTDLVSPVDGFVSEIGTLHEGQMLQAKGRYYDVDDFLACGPERSALFYGGAFATLYLSPRDYHRVHMPMAGLLQEMTHVPGTLFSVQPLTVQHIPRLFARNERLVVFFETAVGPMAMVLVGATVVGAIGTAWQGDLPRARTPKTVRYGADSTVQTAMNKSDEMGYFKLGSTVILLFSKEARVQWESSLQAGSRIQVGQALASFS